MGKKGGLMLAAFLMVILSEGGARGGGPAVVSGVDDRTSLVVTVYEDFALVDEARQIDLGDGTKRINFEGVPASIVPGSVRFGGQGVALLEQGFHYDLITPRRLLEKYVGRQVNIRREDPVTGKTETVSALILSVQNGTAFRVGDEIAFDLPGVIYFPSLPEGLFSVPTLRFLVRAEGGGGGRGVEVSYLTEAMGWSAECVLTLEPGGARGGLGCMASVTNQSGASYEGAAVRLVSGRPRRASYPRPQERMALVASSAGAPEEREFFEYHVYSLPGDIDIGYNETKQFALLGAEGVPVKKELVFEAAHPGPGPMRAPASSEQGVGVVLEVENTVKGGLGRALPKGTVRVYEKEPGGGLDFAGEDIVGHTPVGEKLRVNVGVAFDVVGSKAQAGFRRMDEKTYEEDMEIRLRNHRDEDVSVRVVEHIPGDWKITRSSHGYVKTSSQTAEFLMSVPAGGETVLFYTARVRQ